MHMTWTAVKLKTSIKGPEGTITENYFILMYLCVYARTDDKQNYTTQDCIVHVQLHGTVPW